MSQMVKEEGVRYLFSRELNSEEVDNGGLKNKKMYFLF